MDYTEIYSLFPTEADCIAHLEQIRWNGTPICPYCSSLRITPVPKAQRFHCNNCKTTFSATVQTIFHHTRLSLQKWLAAISLALNTREKMTARHLAKYLEVNKNTACYVIRRIQDALRDSEQRRLLQALVEPGDHLRTDGHQ